MYDPDSLALTKEQILKIIEETMEDYKDNKKMKALGWIMLLFCKKAERHILEGIWSSIAVKVNNIFIQNSLKHAELNGEKWATTFKLIEEGKKEDAK